jgi:hypothetical protein
MKRARIVNKREKRAAGIFSILFVLGWTSDILFVVDVSLYLYLGGVPYAEARVDKPT